MPVRTERAVDADRWFMYSFGTVVTVSPWHLGQAACAWMCSRRCVELTCPCPERADMDVPMAVCTAVMIAKLRLSVTARSAVRGEWRYRTLEDHVARGADIHWTNHP